MNTPETADQLLVKAQGLEESKMYNEIIKLLEDRKLEDLSDPRLYKLKAKAYMRVGRSRDKLRESVKLLTTAIELKSDDPTTYKERYQAYRLIGDFDNASSDINDAIKLDPKFPRYYYWRGTLFFHRRNRKLAERDFAKAMALGAKTPEIYYDLARFWRFHNVTKSISLYEKLLRIDKSHSRATARAAANVGTFYLLKKKNYEAAYKYFSIAADRGIELDLQQELFLFVYKSLSMVSAQKRRRLYLKCIPFVDIVESIRGQLDQSGYGDPVVHFTKLSVADILFSSDNNKFRFYHTANLNDPEEGRTILQIFNDEKITESFANAEMVNESNFYIGSFLPQDHADDLVMWRTYGKDEVESEAKGCSIVFDGNFFDDENYAANPREPAGKGISSQEATDQQEKAGKNHDRRPEQRSRYDATLYKVIYYNALRKKLVADKNEDLIPSVRQSINRLRKHLLEIIKLKDSSKPKLYNLAIDSIVYFVINEVRYFFKSADYSYENEQRVVMPLPPGSPLVKIEENGKLPKRLYVESNIPIRKYVKKIVLGPRVIQPERWVYLKAKMIKAKYEIEMVKSKCKFQ